MKIDDEIYLKERKKFDLYLASKGWVPKTASGLYLEYTHAKLPMNILADFTGSKPLYKLVCFGKVILVAGLFSVFVEKMKE